MMDEKRGAARAAGTIALGLVLLLLAYGSAYLALVRARSTGGVAGGWGAVATYEPEYPFLDDAFQTFFAPAHALDLRVRPSHWSRVSLHVRDDSSEVPSTPPGE